MAWGASKADVGASKDRCTYVHCIGVRFTSGKQDFASKVVHNYEALEQVRIVEKILLKKSRRFIPQTSHLDKFYSKFQTLFHFPFPLKGVLHVPFSCD